MGEFAMAFFMGGLVCSLWLAVFNYLERKEKILNRFAHKYKVDLKKVESDYKRFIEDEKKKC